MTYFKTFLHLVWIGILIVGLVGTGAIIFKVWSELYKIIFIEQIVSNVDLVIGGCLACAVFAIGCRLIRSMNVGM